MTEKRMYRLGIVIAIGLWLNLAVTLLSNIRGAAYAAPPEVKANPVFLCDKEGHELQVARVPIRDGEGKVTSTEYSLSVAGTVQVRQPVMVIGSPDDGFPPVRVQGGPRSGWPIPVFLALPESPIKPLAIPYPVAGPR